jgi:glycosyltransferase involved in cell wall biosynthesis
MEVAGAQQVLLTLADWFQAHGHEVKVLFLYDKRDLQREWQRGRGFPVISLDAWGGALGLFKLLRGLFRLRRQLNSADALVAFTPHSNLVGLLAARLAKVPVRIATHHGYILGSGSLLARTHGWLVNSSACSKLVVVSNELREYVIQAEGARADKISVIENGIAPGPEELDTVEINALHRELEVDPDGLLFLSVGRLTSEKGHSILLEAAAQLDGPHVFALAGEGPKAGELQQLARRLNIATRVRFLGLRHDVHRLLQAADVFVQPSLSEGLPISLLEAMFASRPIVATDVGAAASALNDAGLIVPPGDAAALAAALRRLAEDAGLRRSLGKAAQQRAMEHYTAERMCRSFEQLILSFVSQ